MEILINNIPIYYEIFGDGIPVIMIHGWGVDHRLLEGGLEPVFEKHIFSYKRIYFDLPGMGKTPGSDSIKGSDDMLNVIIQLIDALIPEIKFILVGNSYGGYLSRALIRKMSDRILGLCLIVPSRRPFIEIDGKIDKGDVPEHQVIESDEKFMSTLSDYQRESFEFMAVRQTEDAWKLFKKNVLPGIECADRNFLENNLAQNTILSDDPDHLETPFQKPTLIICGRQDMMVGYKDIYRIIENYPRATFSVLDASGHNINTEQPDLFIELTKNWLKRIEVYMEQNA